MGVLGEVGEVAATRCGGLATALWATVAMAVVLSVLVVFCVLRASYGYDLAYTYPYADALLGGGASASRGTGPHSYVGLDGLRRVHIVASAGVKLPQG